MKIGPAQGTEIGKSLDECPAGPPHSVQIVSQLKRDLVEDLRSNLQEKKEAVSILTMRRWFVGYVGLFDKEKAQKKRLELLDANLVPSDAFVYRLSPSQIARIDLGLPETDVLKLTLMNPQRREIQIEAHGLHSVWLSSKVESVSVNNSRLPSNVGKDQPLVLDKHQPLVLSLGEASSESKPEDLTFLICSNGEFRQQTMRVDFSASNSIIATEIREQAKPSLPLRLSAGLGVNYHQYQQIEDNSELDFFTYKGPHNLYLSAEYSFSSYVAFNLDFKLTPGRTPSISEIGLEAQNYFWTSLQSGLRVFVYKGTLWQFALTAMAQSHDIPFVLVDASATRSDLESKRILTSSFGFQAEFSPSSQKSYLIAMAVQQPLQTSSGFRIFNPRMLDGSLGYWFAKYNQHNWGAFWYGQFLDFSYENSFNGQIRTGQESLIYSNLELRYRFNF